ncbi:MULTISPECIES: response regulator [Lachnospira]|uniref:Stage 0 sporulation protein A homolog n=2 Tax=Lachnospira TaxID=28050 RepID=A0A1H5UHA0_9FIRM|nr:MULTISPECIES: response regulator [Lachnospira]MCR5516901.1 response regulator [Lachnospira sp.]SDM87003.1 Response regulator receiver domain-containing protein [Lachnospira pectinoschiza]SEF74389.1 Response regulator receiver domain-containing protein [Lachnospira multipara]
MHEKIVFIGNDKGFVYGSIKKGLEEQGFNIISVNSDIAYIMGKESESKIWLLYIENEVTDYVKIFEYIKKAVISNDVMLYLIASDSEIRDVHRYIPEHLIKHAFEKPVDMSSMYKYFSLMVLKQEEVEQEKSILIVDDDPSSLRALSDFLSVKYKVYMANSAMNAIMFLTKKKVDLIILDVSMPVVDGTQVFQMLQDEPSTRDIPIMFLTGNSDKDVVMNVLSLHPVKYLLKSMEPDKLILSIDDFLDSRK